MTGYRPTSLKYASKHCPKAMQFWEDGAPQAREVFEAGVAAHAVIQAAGEETNRKGRMLKPEELAEVGRVTGESLIEKGRSFEGVPEGPLGPDRVWLGVSIAVAYLRENVLRKGGTYEVGLAVDENWEPCEYGPGAWLRHIVDQARLLNESDEESGWTTLVVTDYKSAWSTGAAELDTLQRKIGACLAAATYRDRADIMRLEVVNLRTYTTYTREIFLEHGESPELRQYRSEIESTIAALERQKGPKGERPAKPGTRCDGCPFLLQCDWGMDYIERAGGIADHGSLVERAKTFAVVLGAIGTLRSALKPHCEDGPIEIDGMEVGWQRKDKRAVSEAAVDMLWELYEKKGFLFGDFVDHMKPTAGNIVAVAKALIEDEDEREAWIEQATVRKPYREFKARRIEV